MEKQVESQVTTSTVLQRFGSFVCNVVRRITKCDMEPSTEKIDPKSSLDSGVCSLGEYLLRKFEIRVKFDDKIQVGREMHLRYDTDDTHHVKMTITRTNEDPTKHSFEILLPSSDIVHFRLDDSGSHPVLELTGVSIDRRNYFKYDNSSWQDAWYNFPLDSRLNIMQQLLSTIDTLKTSMAEGKVKFTTRK
jgi:hypothetical protein